MRTKTLLLAAAALSVGVLASSAQVYSQNVVGYVNTPFPSGNTLWCNPLKNTTNTLSQLFPAGNDGMTISRWSNADGNWISGTATFYSDNPGAYGTGIWDVSPDFGTDIVLPGEGLILLNPLGTTFTNTFVGDVMQGNLTMTILPGGSMLGSQVPVGGNITNVLAQLVLPDGSSVSTFDNASGVFNSTAATYYNPPQIWDPEINIGVGEGFFLINNSASDVIWNRSFTVQ